MPEPTPNHSEARSVSIAMVVLFVVVISAPLCATLINIAGGPGTVREEQQAPTPRLPHDLRSAAAFPGAFKWYFMDRFGFREYLIRVHGRVKVEWLRTSSHRNVVLGRNGWLFMSGEHVLDDHRGAKPFSHSELAAWVETLRQRTRWLAARGVPYLLVIAPNKETIYPEYLPSALVPASAPTRLDQLAEALASVPEVSWLDLRPTMREAREKSRVYYKTDSHWNAVGGWFAARAIVGRLTDWRIHRFPETAPTPLTTRIIEGGDLARFLGLASRLAEEDLWPASLPGVLQDDSGARLTWKLLDVVYRERVNAVRPDGGAKAVIFRDSFGEALIPWLSQAFGYTVWRWSYGFDEALIERERPLVVIQQITERKLTTIGPDGVPLPGS